MKEQPSAPLRLLPALLLLLLFAEAAGSALAIVHLREEEGRLASSSIKLEGDYNETSRRLHEMTAAVAMAQEPDVLRNRVGNRLSPTLDKQLEWVRPATTAPHEAPAASPGLAFRFASAEPVRALGLPQ